MQILMYVLFVISLRFSSDAIFISYFVALSFGSFQFVESLRVPSPVSKVVEAGFYSVLLTNKSQKNNDMWIGLLSWCKSYELFCHKFGHFHVLPHAKRFNIFYIRIQIFSSYNTSSTVFTIYSIKLFCLIFQLNKTPLFITTKNA